MQDLYQCLVEAPGVAAEEVGDRLCEAQEFLDGMHMVNNAISAVGEIMHHLEIAPEEQPDQAPLVLLRGRLHARTGQVCYDALFDCLLYLAYMCSHLCYSVWVILCCDLCYLLWLYCLTSIELYGRLA